MPETAASQVLPGGPAPARSEGDIALIAGLGRAIEQGRLVPWFQPVMCPGGVEMLSAEALPRWDDPVRGTVPAGVFIPAATRHGLLGEIGRVLMERACANHAAWAGRGIAPPVVSVNVTAEELRSGSAEAAVAAAIATHGLGPANLGLEVAERVLYEPGWQDSVAALARLRDLGVHLWLDDFGSDAGDPAHLDRADFSLTKVDRKVVAALDTDMAGPARLEALVAQAKARRLSIIAKGVETRAQIDILVELGCDGQQGFAIARPMAEEAFAEWLDLNTWT